MKVFQKIRPIFNEVSQKVKSKIQPQNDFVKKIPDYVAVDMNGLIAFVPAKKIPKGAKVLTEKPLTSAADVIAKMNEGMVNKISKQ